ncbi:MAG: hypothetical protein ACPGVG_15370 [Mycobacterium sp.]
MLGPEMVQGHYAALAQEYDDFYGVGAQAPLGAIAAYGDQVATETIAVPTPTSTDSSATP